MSRPQLDFSVKNPSHNASHDAVILFPGEDLRTELVRQVVDNIATSLQVTLGGVTVFLAMLQDPDHWSEDWTAAGIAAEDVDDWLASLLTGATA
jgi:hypothetical protein